MNQSEELFLALAEILKEQLEHYQQIAILVAAKKEALVKADIAALEKTIRAENNHLMKVNRLEKKRLPICEQIYQIHNLNGDTPLKDLYIYASIKQSAELKALHEQFEQLISQISHINNINKVLLETCIDYNDMIITLSTHSEDPLNNFYGNDGLEHEKSIAISNVFDQEA